MFAWSRATAIGRTEQPHRRWSRRQCRRIVVVCRRGERAQPLLQRTRPASRASVATQHATMQCRAFSSAFQSCGLWQVARGAMCEHIVAVTAPLPAVSGSPHFHKHTKLSHHQTVWTATNAQCVGGKQAFTQPTDNAGRSAGACSESSPWIRSNSGPCVE
jgi:hypothetical protein